MNGIHEVRGSIPLGSTTFSLLSQFVLAPERPGVAVFGRETFDADKAAIVIAIEIVSSERQLGNVVGGQARPSPSTHFSAVCQGLLLDAGTCSSKQYFPVISQQ